MNHNAAHELELIGVFGNNQQPVLSLRCGSEHGAEAGPLTGGPDPTRRAAALWAASTGIRRAVRRIRRTPLPMVAVASGGASRSATPLALAVVVAVRTGTRTLAKSIFKRLVSARRRADSAPFKSPYWGGQSE